MTTINPFAKDKMEIICKLSEHKWKKVKLSPYGLLADEAERVEVCDRCGARRVVKNES